jgi:hypothetical protein
MFILCTKLKLLKSKLKTWNKSCFGNVHELVSSAELKLQQVQEQIQEKLASAEFEDALKSRKPFGKKRLQ